jgi:CHAT domain-containing protein
MDCLDCEGAEFMGGEYLVERYSLSYAPSLTTLKYAWAAADEVRDDPLFLALADPDSGDARFPRLVSMQREATAVAALFDPSEVHVAAAATEEVVTSHASSADQLLLSTHGTFNPLNPMFSYLLLSPTDESDGRLYTYEIFSLDLHAALVTLSACETLLPALEDAKDQVKAIRGESDDEVELTEELLEALTAGDEIVGLTRALLYAGTSSVLSTLWQVVSETTEPLMVAFYGYLREGMSKADALREAQLYVMKSYPHPRYWAAFELMGDWRACR